MRIKVAKNAGFCFGVEKAVKKASEMADKKNTFTYGHIVHNKTVVNNLAQQGVKSIDNINEVIDEDSTIIIRAHGVSKKVMDDIETKGLEVIDATCPYVKKIHHIVQKESEKNRNIIIIGSEAHPEVQGIIGWCKCEPIIIDTVEKAQKLSINIEKPLSIIAQTTFNLEKFQNLVEIIQKKGYDINVLNTICGATKQRQIETNILAEESDVMLVVGDKKSSNTQKLFEISKEKCEDTYYIQTLADLKSLNLDFNNRCVGITAGASTPNNIIEEVLEECQKILNKC